MKTLIRNFPLLLLAVAGCSSAAPATSQAELDKLTALCNVPKSTLRLENGFVIFGQAEMPHLPADRVRCLLDGLKARGLDGKMGFAGNGAKK